MKKEVKKQRIKEAKRMQKLSKLNKKSQEIVGDFYIDKDNRPQFMVRVSNKGKKQYDNIRKIK